MPAKVLLVAPDDDTHAVVVRQELERQGAVVAFTDLSRVLEQQLVVDPGGSIDLGSNHVDRAWTVWWRRTGSVPTHPEMSELENRLRREETEAILFGGLIASEARWVDDPSAVVRAEHTLLQLAVARRLGARVPETIATNSPIEARRMLAAGRCIAKATSSGIGLAPFADFIDGELIELLPAAATVLQRYIPADADLRVIVVGDESFVWQRPRDASEPADWRAADPSGAQFTRVAIPGVGPAAVEITRQLGLTFSVQDWLLRGDEPWFLEVNPVGQWLFLDGAEAVIAPALATHLTHATVL